MKKTLVSALTAALVVGAASTTFAAANPFSDVPADHWAYDAVSQLAADGVIEGYGDTTFQGDKNITRYEMAQMIARAMAKNTATGNDKALLDKLAAEFSDELNNLGVRVSKLERNADMVKWNGEMRNRVWSQRDEGSHMKNKYQTRFRLKPTAEINENWHVKGQFDADLKINEDSTGTAKMTDVYALANYPGYDLQLGKFPLFTDSDEGLTYDTHISGAKLTFGKNVKAVLTGGRFNLGKEANDAWAADEAANAASLELMGSVGKMNLGAGYHYLKADKFKTVEGYSKNHNENKAGIWAVSGRYTFDKNASLLGAYSQNEKADAYEKSGNVEFDYKGADKANAGTWGAYAAYRHIGWNASPMATFDTLRSQANVKGWEVGGTYAPFKNVMAWVSYFDGKDLKTDASSDMLFGRVSFYF